MQMRRKKMLLKKYSDMIEGKRVKISERKHYYIKRLLLLVSVILICSSILGCTNKNAIPKEILGGATMNMKKDEIIDIQKKAGHEGYGEVENTIIYNGGVDYLGYDAEFILYEFDDNDRLIGFSGTFEKGSVDTYDRIKNNMISKLGNKYEEEVNDYSCKAEWSVQSHYVTLMLYESILNNESVVCIMVEPIDK